MYVQCSVCGSRFDNEVRATACPHDGVNLADAKEKVNPLAPKVPEGHGSGDGRPVPGEKPPQRARRFVGSTSDDRTVNNVMRHQYKVLSNQEKLDMQFVKDRGLEFFELLQEINQREGVVNPNNPNAFNSRELSLAATKIEEAVMWAVKHLTK